MKYEVTVTGIGDFVLPFMQTRESVILVTAVGDEAMKTLRENGHCTIVFTGKDAVEQPGQIMVKGDGVPRFMVGDVIRFE